MELKTVQVFKKTRNLNNFDSMKWMTRNQKKYKVGLKQLSWIHGSLAKLSITCKMGTIN